MDEEVRVQHIAPLQANPLDLHTFLQSVKYPVTKREILATMYAGGMGARDFEFLNTLPDQEYMNLSHLLITLEDILDF